MKRYIHILLAAILLVGLLLPVSASAMPYKMHNTDISLQVDDTRWYVFTPDNILGNPELEELGITYDWMKQFFTDNNAYMDAILYYEDGNYIELFVRKKATDSGVANLSNHNEKFINKVAKGAAEELGAEDYSIYENQYKFIDIEYYDAEVECYVCQYITIVNKDVYTVSFQASAPYTQEQHQEMKEILQSNEFKFYKCMKVNKNIKRNKIKKKYNFIKKQNK